MATMRLFGRLIAAEVQRQEMTARTMESAQLALRLADTDTLTGTFRRRRVMPWLLHALNEADHEHEVVVAFHDINHFKNVNDTLGHAAGDAVLVHVAERARRSLRAEDLLARYGGDEFLVAAVLPPEAMPDLARRLHDLEHLNVIVPGLEHELDVHLSIGIASEVGGPATEADVQSLIHRADQAMYAVKPARPRQPSSAPSAKSLQPSRDGGDGAP